MGTSQDTWKLVDSVETDESKEKHENKQRNILREIKMETQLTQNVCSAAKIDPIKKGAAEIKFSLKETERTKIIYLNI